MIVAMSDGDAEQKLTCVVTSEIDGSRKSIEATDNMTMAEFYRTVSNATGYKADTFDLAFVTKDGQNQVIDSTETNITLSILGLRPKGNRFLIQEMDGVTAIKEEDVDETSDSKRGLQDVVEEYGPSLPASNKNTSALGTSATAVTTAAATSSSTTRQYTSNWSTDGLQSDTGFVGLANQGATCYLNSLLQTLYMTPEFRRAMYRWRQPKSAGSVDSNAEKQASPGDEKNLASSAADSAEDDDEHVIPRELQNLFLSLQTSKARAVSTTAVTKSFGWDRSDSFQQHDVQELLRVLFDALEDEWRGTELNTVIKDLYEGTLCDFVKCQECGYESQRNDKYLDVPLVIKPFGSSRTLGSVDEGLKFFAQVEKLEGDNQYDCPECKKKSDASKGLKIVTAPYVLTLQLKRFDFDYNTFQRIKLNNRFEFPFELDMGPYLGRTFEESELDDPHEQEQTASEDATQEAGKTASLNKDQPGGDKDNIAKEISETMSAPDNGTIKAADTATTAHVVPFETLDSSDDESMNGGDCDAKQGDDTSEPMDASTSAGSDEPDAKNDQVEDSDDTAAHGARNSDHLYELFSVMIHSGSALGGHYYAYIKDFDDGRWYCFNDSSVSEISTSEIENAFGGQTRYSYGYGSSASAYMLMYRKVDTERNQLAPKSADMSQHLVEALERMDAEAKRQKEIEERKKREVTLNVYRQYADGRIEDTSKELATDKFAKVEEVITQAKKLLEIDDSTPLERLRLCKYVTYRSQVESAYDPEKSLHDSGMYSNYSAYDVTLQIADENGNFPELDADKIVVIVNPYFVEQDRFGEKMKVSVPAGARLVDLRNAVAEALEWEDDRTAMAKNIYPQSPPHIMNLDERTLRDAYIWSGDEMFAAECPMAEDKDEVDTNPFYKALEQKSYGISLRLIYPDEDENSEGHPVTVDSRQTLHDFKVNIIEPLVAPLKHHQFTVHRFRSFHDDKLMEVAGLTENLTHNQLKDGARVWIKRGFACKPGQYPVTVTLLDIANAKKPKVLFERCPVSPGQTAKETVQEILEFHELMKRGGIEPLMTHTDGDSGDKNAEAVQGLQAAEEAEMKPVDGSAHDDSGDKNAEAVHGLQAADEAEQGLQAAEEAEASQVDEPVGGDADSSTAKADKADTANTVKDSDENEAAKEMSSATPSQAHNDSAESSGNSSPTVSGYKYANLDLDPSRIRLWDGNSIHRISAYYTAEKRTSLYFYAGKVFHLELLPPGYEEEGDANECDVLFLRHWHRDTLELGLPQRMLLRASTGEQVFQQVAEFVGIPREHLEVISSPDLLPFDSSPLDIRKLEFTPKAGSLYHFPLYLGSDGCCLYYRDARVPDKELSAKDQEELEKAEVETKKKQNSSKHTTTYRRTEKALVIKRKKRNPGTSPDASADTKSEDQSNNDADKDSGTEDAGASPSSMTASVGSDGPAHEE